MWLPDYLVLLSGTVKLTFMDGTTKMLNPGDLFINVSGVHKWTNESQSLASEWIEDSKETG